MTAADFEAAPCRTWLNKIKKNNLHNRTTPAAGIKLFVMRMAPRTDQIAQNRQTLRVRPRPCRGAVARCRNCRPRHRPHATVKQIEMLLSPVSKGAGSLFNSSISRPCASAGLSHNVCASAVVEPFPHFIRSRVFRPPLLTQLFIGQSCGGVFFITYFLHLHYTEHTFWLALDAGRTCGLPKCMRLS